MWTRPTTGGQWRRHAGGTLDVPPTGVRDVKGFEMLDGEEYILVFDNTILMRYVRRNMMMAPVDERLLQGQSLRGVIVESAPEYLMVLTRTNRQGVQTPDGRFTALHFLGHRGQSITHALECDMNRLCVHRYAEHVMFVKDPDVHPRSVDLWLDDDWHPDYAHHAGWLWSLENVSLPPLEVHLPPDVSDDWSICLARGGLGEDNAPNPSAESDRYFRLYLLDGVKGSLWMTTRRVDDGYDTVFERPMYNVYDETKCDGRQLARHALAFAEVPTDPVGGVMNSLLWSFDLSYVCRPNRTCDGCSYWQCSVGFDSVPARPHASHPVALSCPCATVVAEVQSVDYRAEPQVVSKFFRRKWEPRTTVPRARCSANGRPDQWDP